MAGPQPQIRPKEEQPLSISIRKLGVLGLVAAVLLVFGMLRPGVPSPTSEAAFLAPGGLIALPSMFPGLPAVANQPAPAMIPASPPGNQAMIDVFANPTPGFFVDNGAIFDSNCNINAAGVWDGLGSVCFKVQAIDMSTFALVGTAATFAATGSDRLLCSEADVCDLSGGGVVADGIISVLLNGGGKDELLQVTATDETGATNTVQVIAVQTMIAVPPIVETAATPLAPLPPGFSIIGYRCDNVGAVAFTAAAAPLWVPASLAAMSDLIYGTLDMATPQGVNAGQFYGCGMNTTGNPTDDLVMFQTDVGQMSLQPLSVVPAITAQVGACPQGKSVSIADGGAWAWPLPPGPPWNIQTCDYDVAPNGTVGYLAVRTADVGQATVTGQQGSMASSTRQTYVNFIGEPAAGIIPTIELLAEDLSALPDLVSPVVPLNVVALVLNQSLNPLAGKTVTCTIDPANGMFALLLDRDTTGVDGLAHFQLVPSNIPGTEITLSCSLDSYPNIPPATHTFTSSLTPNLETVDLVEGCNPIAATWADGTAIATVAGAVDPAAALEAIWKFDTASGTWQGYSPSAPAAVNDLVSVNRLDAIFVCVNATATIARPVI
jgi:hypothetical protein